MNSESKNESEINVITNDISTKSNINKCNDIYKVGKHHWPAGNFIDLIGKRFDKLLVIKRLQNDIHNQSIWLCQCDCGIIKPVSGANLRNRHSKSCGCWNVYATTQRNLKPKYYWIFSMVKRVAKYNNKVCSLTYDDILEFVKINKCHYCSGDIVWKEHGIVGELHSYMLDRKNNSIGYTKENCVVCCSVCNRVKFDVFTYDEMLYLGKIVEKIFNERKYDQVKTIVV
jgi:hypothetical protein